MQRKALEMGISLHRGPVGEPGGDLLSRGLREKDEIFLSGDPVSGNPRDT